jgi:phasin family protein
MMAITLQQQLLAATHLQTEHQLELWTALHSVMLDAVDQIADLHLHVVRETLGESTAFAAQWLAPRNPQDLLSSVSDQVQPNVERLTAYTCQLTEIANIMRRDIGQIVQEELQNVRQQAATTMEGMMAPSDGDAFAAWLQSALDAANAGHKQLMATAAQLGVAPPSIRTGADGR